MKRKSIIAVLTSLAVLALVASASAQVFRCGSYIGGDNAFASPFCASVTVPEGTPLASNSTSYVLTPEGVEYAFGDGTEGELGDGKAEDSATPVRIEVPEEIAAEGESRDAGFAIGRSGQLWAWGESKSGTLCLGAKPPKFVLSPTKVAGVTEAVQVRGGRHHTEILLADHHVLSCGENGKGQLGLGKAVKSSNVPVEVPGLSNVVEISAGELQSGARTASGEVFLWGSNAHGQDCLSSSTPAVFTPRRVEGPAALQISVGGDVSTNGQTVVVAGGELEVCGANTDGQLGDGTDVAKEALTATGIHCSAAQTAGNYSLCLDEGLLFGMGKGEGLGLAGEHRTPALVGEASSIWATAENTVGVR
jgi:alpha-tubulin suppressor-like RCC1 family protein